MRIIYDDAVLAELVKQAAYYAEIDKDLAFRFLDACDACFELISKNIYIGSHKTFDDSQLSEVRMWRVKGFDKHLVFYAPDKDGIRILHIIHSSVDYNRVFDNE